MFHNGHSFLQALSSMLFHTVPENTLGALQGLGVYILEKEEQVLLVSRSDPCGFYWRVWKPRKGVS